MTTTPDAAGNARPGGGEAPAETAARQAVDVAARRLIEKATGQLDPGGDDAAGRRVWVLNGVNLGRLGKRDPLVYGATTHAELTTRLVDLGVRLGVQVQVRQTDQEAELIGWLHEAADESIPVVLNPAAWSHYSIALRDAVAQRTADLVEVHISNIHAREEFRHHSVVSAVATGVVAGLGIAGYEVALRFLVAGPSTA